MNYSPSNKNYCRSSVRVIFITVGRSRVRRQGPDRDTRHWVLSLILTSLNKRSWIVLNVENDFDYSIRLDRWNWFWTCLLRSKVTASTRSTRSNLSLKPDKLNITRPSGPLATKTCPWATRISIMGHFSILSYIENIYYCRKYIFFYTFDCAILF